MKIGICDDEKEIREELRGKIQGWYPEAEVVCYASGDEVLDAPLPDLLLLDICMNKKNGMETARELRNKSRDVILIFISGVRDYVFEAFDVEAFHYLVKPFSEDKLREVLQQALRQFGERPREAEDFPRRLLITANGQHIAVCPDDIIYAEVFDRKVVIHTVDEDIEYYGKLKDLEERLGEDFYRTHRSYLVHFAYVRRYEAGTVWLEKGRALLAKQKYRDFVRQYLHYNRRKGSR